MNQLLLKPPVQADSGRHMVFWHIGWKGFQGILDIMPSRRLRAAYSKGDLEVMSPLPLHEKLKVFFGYLLLAIAGELKIVMHCLGSTTYRRSDVDRGIEPDQSFYFSSYQRIKDWTDIDLATDPPPDLAIEVDITSSVLDRIGIYEALKVPELWRWYADDLSVLCLDEGGKYQPTPASKCLPFLPINEIPALFHSMADAQSDVEVLDRLHVWVRERLLPLYQTDHASDS